MPDGYHLSKNLNTTEDMKMEKCLQKAVLERAKQISSVSNGSLGLDK